MTTTNRERREAVIDALILHHHVSEDGDISFAGMADAAFAAALPDRAAFEAAVDRVIQAVETFRDDRSISNARNVAAARDDLIALVYGSDEEPTGEGVACA